MDVDGILTITGNGPMKNYIGEGLEETLDFSPWSNYLSEIKSVVIDEGVTAIGDYAFAGMMKKNSQGEYIWNKKATIEHLILPEGITYIGKYAFAGAEFQEIGIPSTV